MVEAKKVKIKSEMICTEISQGNLTFKIQDAEEFVDTNTIVIKDPFGEELRTYDEIEAEIVIEIKPLPIKS